MIESHCDSLSKDGPDTCPAELLPRNFWEGLLRPAATELLYLPRPCEGFIRLMHQT